MYYDRLPAIDRARVFLMEKRPKRSPQNLTIEYTNTYAQKHHLKATLSKMDLPPEKLTSTDNNGHLVPKNNTSLPLPEVI